MRKRSSLKKKLKMYSLVPLFIVEILTLLCMYLTLQGKVDAKTLLPSLLSISAVAFVIMVTVSIVVSIVINSMVNSLRRTMQVLDQTANGDLTGLVNDRDLSRKDEIGKIAENVQVVNGALSDMIGKVNDTSSLLATSASHLNQMAEQTSTTSDEVARAMSDMASGAAAQAHETQTVTEEVVNIGEKIAQTADDVEMLNENAEHMKTVGMEGVHAVDDLEQISQKVKEEIALIHRQTNTTNESAQRIFEATELIKSIASETNLLALNASIEAARAGESGRGFAVVAEQIKNLSEQSNNSVQTIEEIIANLMQDSNDAVKTMERVNEIINVQCKKVETTKQVFDQVNEGLLISTKGVNHIADNTRTLDEAKERVISAIENLSSIAQENAAATEQIAASAQELTATIAEINSHAEDLSGMSDQLNADMNVFNV